MKRWVWLLAFLVALPVGGDEKGKKDEKKPAPAKAGSTVDDLLKQADEKAAAGEVDASLDLLQRAAALPGATGEPSLRLGRLLEARYDLDLAIDAYKAAAEKLSGAAKGEALGRLSVVEGVRGMAEAAATAQAAAAADPEGVWPTLALSRARAREGKGEEAVALARKAGAGGGVAATEALGYAQEALGDLVAAEATYRSALAAKPGGVGPSLGLARVLRKTNRAAEAEPLLKKVLEAAPGAIEAYKESARVKMALNRAAEAEGDAATAAAMAENDPEAQRLVLQVKVAKALDYLPKNQVELAVQDLTALRDQNPNAAEVRVGLARVLIAKRQGREAVAELKKAIELEPTNAEAHFRLGFVLHALLGDPTSALAAYEQAVAADPANIEYRTNLGAVLSDLKQYDRAVAELTKITADPGYTRPEAWIYLGEAQLGAKHYKEAIAALQKAASSAPENARVQASLAWAYFGLKDAENFKKAAGKARALGHKEPTLLQYLTRVEGGEPIK